MFSLWATAEGDIVEVGETGAWGLFRGIGGFRIVDVAKVLKSFEILIIPVLGLY